MVRPWRNPQFHFLVGWGWGNMRCREVVGLPEVHPGGENHGGQFAEILADKTGGHMPGSVMLRQITVISDVAFTKWLMQVQGGVAQASSVTVSLIFDNKPPSVVWALDGAFPVKVAETAPGVREGEVTMKELMLAYDALTVIRS